MVQSIYPGNVKVIKLVVFAHTVSLKSMDQCHPALPTLVTGALEPSLLHYIITCSLCQTNIITRGVVAASPGAKMPLPPLDLKPPSVQRHPFTGSLFPNVQTESTAAVPLHSRQPQLIIGLAGHDLGDGMPNGDAGLFDILL